MFTSCNITRAVVLGWELQTIQTGRHSVAGKKGNKQTWCCLAHISHWHM